MITLIKMTVRSSSKRIQTLLGSFDAVLFAIIVFKKYLPTYLSRVSRWGQLKTRVKPVHRVVLVPFSEKNTPLAFPNNLPPLLK
jgi:hypothetical protein